MGISRRAALKGLLVGGAAAAGVDIGAAPRPPRRSRLTMRSACSTTRRSASAARPACRPAARRTTSKPIRPAWVRNYHAPLDLSERAKTVIKLLRDDGRDVVRESAVHALRRSGLRGRLHARRAAETRVRDRHLRPRPVHRLPLLRGRVPVQRAEVRVDEGGAEDRQVRIVRSQAEGRARTSVHRGLPSRRSDLRQAK